MTSETAQVPEFPPPNSDPSEDLASQRRIVQRSAGDLAALRGQVLFALQVMGVWFIGAFICSSIGGMVAAGMSPEEPSSSGAQAQAVAGAVAGQFIVLALVGLWSFVLLQVFLGGTARLVAAHLQAEGQITSSTAWRFLARHWLGVIAASSVTTVAVSIALAGVLWVIHGTAADSPAMGSALILPVWLLVLFALSLLWNCQLLPVVMGVENCNARTATARLFGRNPFWLARTSFQVLQASVPQILASLPLTLIAVAITWFATNGNLSFENFGGAAAERPFESVSYVAIAALWLGYAASVVAGEFAVEYYNKS